MKTNSFRPVMPSGIKGILFYLRMKFSSMSKRMELLRPYFHYLGKDVKLFSPSLPSELYLISIEDNVMCASGVRFLTHDASINHLMRITPGELMDSVGSIVLRENCFIGAFSTLMPNCSVGKNSIVAAGSIVTKHIPDNEVWGGVPARKLMEISELRDKKLIEAKKLPWLHGGTKLTGNDLVQSREHFFFEDDFKYK